MFLTILQAQKNTLCRGNFFNKSASFHPPTLPKKKLQHRCFQWIYEIFKNTYVVEYLWTVASGIFSIAVGLTRAYSYEFTLKFSELLLSYQKLIQNPVKHLTELKISVVEFFCSVFSFIRTEYGETLRSISPYSVWMRENMDKKNSEYGYLSRNV